MRHLQKNSVHRSREQIFPHKKNKNHWNFGQASYICMVTLQTIITLQKLLAVWCYKVVQKMSDNFIKPWVVMSPSCANHTSLKVLDVPRVLMQLCTWIQQIKAQPRRNHHTDVAFFTFHLNSNSSRVFLFYHELKKHPRGAGCCLSTNGNFFPTNYWLTFLIIPKWRKVNSQLKPDQACNLTWLQELRLCTAKL